MRGKAVPAAFAAVLAIAMTWPLVLHLGSQTNVIDFWGDPLYLTWQVAWIGHALLHDPLQLLHSNLYYPIKDNLALTDVLFGYAPAGLLGTTSPHAALVVHNLLFIFTFALAFLGAYLLARELGAGDWGAAAAGAAFAYAPWKLGHAGHMHVLSSGGIPLSLYLLVRGYRRRRAHTIVAGWLVAAWQMTLGFNLGLQLVYLFVALALVAVGVWVAGGRQRPHRTTVRASAVGICAFIAVTTLVAVPYLQARRSLAQTRAAVSEVEYYSPPLRGFLTTTSSDLVWGDVTAHRRALLPKDPIEVTLFPGVTVVLLALLGLASAAYPLRLRIGLAAGTLLCFALSYGFHPNHPLTPFRILYDFAPGWDNVRTPGRINNLTSLGLALLAGAGLALLVRSVRRVSPAAAHATGAVCVAAILVEGFGPIPHVRVQPVPPGQLAAPTPELNLPTYPVLDGDYAYWGIGTFPTMANSAASFDPTVILNMRTAVQNFPDAQSVRFLRRIGVRSVILHRRFAVGGIWRDAANRPVAGLGITRRYDGDLVIFDLGT
jgi:hypothetical protein